MDDLSESSRPYKMQKSTGISILGTLNLTGRYHLSQPRHQSLKILEFSTESQRKSQSQLTWVPTFFPNAELPKTREVKY